MLDESNGLSLDNTNLTSRSTPETPPAAPLNPDVPVGDGKLDLCRSELSDTVTGCDVHHISTASVTGVACSPDTCRDQLPRALCRKAPPPPPKLQPES